MWPTLLSRRLSFGEKVYLENMSNHIRIDFQPLSRGELVVFGTVFSGRLVLCSMTPL